LGVVNRKRGGEVPDKETLTGRVSYRLGDEAMRQVEKLAIGQGISANEWCRQAVLEKLAERKRTQAAPAQATAPGPPAAAPSNGPRVTEGEAMIFEEVLRLRFLIRQIVLRYMEGNLNGHGWSMIEHFTDGNMFWEVAAKWAERHGVTVKEISGE
jgi:hypothetical protein